jgi:hypothetical protein
MSTGVLTMPAHAVILCAAMIAASVVACGASTTYPQLVADYKTVSEPPRPAPAFDFVNRALLPAGAAVHSAAKAFGGAVWVVTDKGSYRITGNKAAPLMTPTLFKPWQPAVMPGLKVRQVVNDAAGHVWVATSAGLYVTDGDQWWQSIDRRDGMPYENMTCVFLSPNGDVWGGTTEGAWRLRAGRFRYFWGKRWLPGNVVSTIWTDAQNRVFISTDVGVSCIEERPMTLAQKAAHYNQITQARHNRRGFICDVGLKVPGDPSQGVVPHAADNDGLWTAYYVGAMALRYAVTKDPAARNEARHSMNAVLDLERLTGIPGFPARAVITDEEIAAGVRGYQKGLKVEYLGESMDQPGGGEPKWFRSPIEKNVWCKGDTSSDEIDGHYFAWYLYWTHVADAEEKVKIAATVRRVTDWILKNDYTLIDHTGHKTRWGVWAPKYLNDDPLWFGERPLNSMEILSHLTTAYTITGDRRYLQAKEELITKHHYLLNALRFGRGEHADWWITNHSDDQLAFVSYYPWLLQETDPDRRRLMTEMLARAWEESPSGEQTLRAEHASLYNFGYGALTGNPCDVESGIENLRDWPWDLVEWTVRNSHRADVTIKQHQGGGGRNKQEIDRVLPASERPVDRWNTDTWNPDGGSNGAAEQCGSAWLLAYWMGVYHGYIDPKQ